MNEPEARNVILDSRCFLPTSNCPHKTCGLHLLTALLLSPICFPLDQCNHFPSHLSTPASFSPMNQHKALNKPYKVLHDLDPAYLFRHSPLLPSCTLAGLGRLQFPEPTMLSSALLCTYSVLGTPLPCLTPSWHPAKMSPPESIY